MGKIYTYLLDVGNIRAEVICTTKAEAEKARNADLRMSSREVLTKVSLRNTPYTVPR